MGPGRAVLLQHELALVVQEGLEKLAENLKQREAGIAGPGAELADVEKGLGRRESEVAVPDSRDIETRAGPTCHAAAPQSRAERPLLVWSDKK